MYNKESSYTFSSQEIGMKGIVNARDLGGYVMADGRTIRKGLLLRGGSLYQATPDDLHILKEKYKVKHIFDFRKKEEVEYHPDQQVPDAEYHWLPTLHPDSGAIIDHIMEGVPANQFVHYMTHHTHLPIIQNLAKDFYISMITNEYTQLQYAIFLQTVVKMDEGAVFWHCSQGKDRTGLAAVFLLAALGADKEIILNDFDISNEFYQKEIDTETARILGEGGTEEQVEVIKTFIGANKRYLEDALKVIDTQYNGLQNYLRNELVLSENDIAALQERILI